MKELSIEEKAKRYDEILARATGAYLPYYTEDIMSKVKKFVDYLLPELAESEDEKTIKEIKQFIRSRGMSLAQSKVDSWLAWLEKQGEPVEINPTEFDTRLQALIEKFDSLPKEELIGSLSFWMNVIQNDGTYKSDEKQGEQMFADGTFVNVDDVREDFVQEVYRVLDADSTNDRANQIIDAFDNLPTVAIEKQGEQKPADKVELKFHEGDWVIDKQGIVHQIANVIENVSNHTHGYDIVGGGYFNDNTEGVRLWTIQDAKDGDVLVDGNLPFIFKRTAHLQHSYAYCGISVDDGFRISKGDIWTWMQDIKPAAKEQRALLFQKMKEAGYEWNSEKKELNKIGQKPVVTPKFRVGDIITPKGKKEYYTITDIVDEWYEFKEKHVNGGIPIYYQFGWELVDQNPAWSEEDERKINGISMVLESWDSYHVSSAGLPSLVPEYISWLKSLKDKVQPKQEWSEEDERMKNQLVDFILSGIDISKAPYGCVAWLNSLRNIK